MRYNDSPFDLQTGMFADKDVRDDLYDQAVSMIDSFYKSKEKVSALLAARFGSSYPDEHPDEVIALTTLLECKSVAWASLLWQRESLMSLSEGPDK